MYSGKYKTIIPFDDAEQEQHIARLKENLEAGREHAYTNLEIVLIRTIEELRSPIEITISENQQSKEDRIKIIKGLLDANLLEGVGKMCNAAQEFGCCEVCSKPNNLIRTTFHYDIKCECHSPNHFVVVRHCKDCKPKEPREIKVTLKASLYKVGRIKPGDEVVMYRCSEAELDKYKKHTFLVTSEPWDLCGTEVVKLHGYAGGFATEFLQKVQTNCIGLSACGGPCEWCPGGYTRYGGYTDYEKTKLST